MKLLEGKQPQINDLERRLGIAQSLEPVLENGIKTMQKVVDVRGMGRRRLEELAPEPRRRSGGPLVENARKMKAIEGMQPQINDFARRWGIKDAFTEAFSLVNIGTKLKALQHELQKSVPTLSDAATVAEMEAIKALIAAAYDSSGSSGELM